MFKKIKIAQYYPFIITMQKIYALYPLGPNASKIVVFFVTLLSVITPLQQFLTVIVSALYAIWTDEIKNNIGDLAQSITSVIIMVSAFLHYVYHRLKAKGTEELHMYLLKNFRYSSEENGVGEKETMEWSIKLIKMLSLNYYVGCIFTVTANIVTPLTSSERILPIPGWYPYDWTVSPFYEMTYLFQATVTYSLCFTFPSYELIYGASIVYAVAQFKILEVNMKNVVYTALLNYGVAPEHILLFSKEFNKYGHVNEDEHDGKSENKVKVDAQIVRDVYNIIDDASFNESLHNSMANCIRQHQILLRLCAMLEEYFSPLLFFKIFISTTIICFVAFCTTIVENKSLLIGLMMYLCVSFTDTLLVTLPGSFLYDASQKLLDSLYQAPWYICSHRFRTSFLTVQKRICLRPAKLTAMGFFDVNLDAYVNTLRTAFSYYTLLQEVTAS